jgi:hypothetical protein
MDGRGGVSSVSSKKYVKFSERMQYMEVDYDRLFKELLQTFFEEFILLFFPQVHEHIDFQCVSFLSEELFTDVTAGEKYRANLLVETKLK